MRHLVTFPFPRRSAPLAIAASLTRHGLPYLLAAGITLGSLRAFLAWGLRNLTRPARAAQLNDPAAFGLPHEEVWFTATDGVRLHGWWIPSARPAAPTLLFLHGYAGSKDPDLCYAALLQPRFNVLMFDFRGHGRSGGNRTSLGYLECRDVAGALRWLRRERRVGRVGVLGFSMGGAVAVLAAARYPEIAAVAVDGAFGDLRHALASEGRRRGFPPLVREALAWLLALAAARHLGFPNRAGQPLRWVHRIAPRPLLVIHGSADDVCPLPGAHRLVERAREPKELWIIPGAAHCDSLSHGAEVYRDRLVAFFERALAADSSLLTAAD